MGEGGTAILPLSNLCPLAPLIPQAYSALTKSSNLDFIPQEGYLGLRG